MFKWISNLNQVIFLLLLLAGSYFIGSEILGLNSRDSNVIEVAEGDYEVVEEKLELGSLQSICGSEIQYIKLNMIGGESRGSKFGHRRSPRNVVFISGEEKDTNWLRDDNLSLIPEMRILTDGESCDERKPVAIFYEMILSDSDGDGVLSLKDNVVPAVSDLDGSNLLVFSSSYSEILDYNFNSSDSELSLLVKKEEDVYLVSYSIENNKVINERKIVGVN